MKRGLYDLPVDRALARALAEVEAALVTEAPLDPVAAPEQLARVVQARLRRALEAIGGSEAERRDGQVTLTNRVLAVLEQLASGVVLPDDALVEPGRRLLEVAPPAPPGLGRPEATPRPHIGLATSDLLVNGSHDLRWAPSSGASWRPPIASICCAHSSSGRPAGAGGRAARGPPAASGERACVDHRLHGGHRAPGPRSPHRAGSPGPRVV